MSKLLEVSELRKSYGAYYAVNNLNFTIETGKITGLLGPNGCGKTTAMKIIAGLIKDYTGHCLINGIAPNEETKKITAYLPERSYLEDWVKPRGAIQYFSWFFEDFDKVKALELLKRFDLDPEMKLKSMSKGMREKVQLIMIMCRNAKLYLLDEPLSGIDPAARSTMLDIIIKNYNPDSAILMSTHLIHDVEHIFDRVMLMGNGSIFVDKGADELREEAGKSIDLLFREVFSC